MAYLEEHEWIALNEMGYNVAFIYDFDEMRRTLLNWLNILIDFDGGVFSLIKVDGAEISTNKSFGYNIPKKHVATWDKEVPLSKIAQIMVLGVNSATITNNEMYSNERIQKSSIYKNFFLPLNYFYSMNTCFVFKNEAIGYLNLFRERGKKPFSKRDVFIVDQLYKHVAYRLSYESNKSETRFFTAKAYLQQLGKKYQFTERELELFECAINGMSNSEIADNMKISIHTVKKHFHHIYEKMDISGRVELLQSLPHSYSKINFDEL